MMDRYSSLGNSAASTCVRADPGCSGHWGSLFHLSTPYFLASFSMACCWSNLVWGWSRVAGGAGAAEWRTDTGAVSILEKGESGDPGEWHLEEGGDAGARA